MILAFKYRAGLHLRQDFADWLEAAVRARFSAPSADLILPMPASPLHRLDRGYNQCAVLADALAVRLDRESRHDVISRTGSPKRQAGLDEAARRENVKNTFAVNRPDLVRGRTVLVVDDIMTTGSTLSECARTLKAAGASRVWCVTLARSVRD